MNIADLEQEPHMSMAEELLMCNTDHPLDVTESQTLSDLCVQYGLTRTVEKEALTLFYHRFRKAAVVNAVCPFFCTGMGKIDRQAIYDRAIAHGLPAKIHPKFTGVSVKYNTGSQAFTAIYFASGAINCVGVKCLKREGIQYVEDTLRKYAPVLFGEEQAACMTYSKKISNRVVALRVPPSINLNHLELFTESEQYWRNCKYQLDIFPGLIYIIPHMKAKVLYFRTGSMICCGITSTHMQCAIGLILAKKLAYYLSQVKQKFKESVPDTGVAPTSTI